MNALVHTSLAHWAQHTPHQTAIVCDNTTLSFQQLHQAVLAQAALHQTSAATCLVNDADNTLQQLIAFLGIVQSGRCAAVTDAEWPAHIRQAVVNALPTSALAQHNTQDTDPFYIGFTSGSTGTPKGFQRDHRSWVESFRVCAETFDMGQDLGILAPGRLSHSLFLFGMLLGLYTGAGVALQNKFSASQALTTLQGGAHPCLVAVPSQLIMLMQWAQRRHIAAVPQVRLILISGARWMRQHTPQLQTLFPNALIIEFYGASETSFIAWKEAHEQTSALAVGRPFANVEIDIRPFNHCKSTKHTTHTTDALTTETSGLIYVRSPMLFMNYVGAHQDPTAAVRDGDWLTVGDMGYIDAQGYLCLSGRQNRMIVTQGKNLFPEELENLLTTHPCITNASVHALPDTVRGSQVVAVLQPASEWTHATPDTLSLTQWCQPQIEAFKIPRHFFICNTWPMTASGKTDHARIHSALLQWFGNASGQPAPAPQDELPCLHTLS